MVISDGFPGQRMVVVPRPRVREFLDQPGTSRLAVTDCGFFPNARSHGVRRPVPISQGVILVCADGRGWCEVGGARFDVAAGQVMVLPPGHPHAYGSHPEEPWTLWWMHVDGPDVAAFFAARDLGIDSPVHSPSSYLRLIHLMEEIVLRMERDTTTSSLIGAAGAAWHALSMVATDRGRTDIGSSVVAAASEYLRANLGNHLSVDELAKTTHLSTSHFSALFKKQFGVPVLQYQTQLRMARARELLDTSRAPIAQIAEEVGYDDPFYFARQFRRIHGVAPRDYRNQRKG